MADKAISELTPVTSVTANDNFVLEQNSRAMRLTGQVLLNWLANEMDAHGGIRRVEKTGTNVLEDTYSIIFADETSSQFTVTNGRGIDNIQKTGTNVLVDTYTITFNDETSIAFNVTNGNGITNIRLTGQSGLVDTYTIYFGNGTTYNFNVANGKGVVEISKTGTNVLTDTYTITYNDATSGTFNVVNGKGITGVQKTGTSGLYDTYTISYNDGSTSTFTLKNGEKGDKGDKGDNITVSNISYAYANGGTSGTVPPSDSSNWSEAPPIVAGGEYLWTRTRIIYSDSTVQTSYIVARQGLDGSGSVRTVNNVGPDANGNVDLVRVSGHTLVFN